MTLEDDLIENWTNPPNREDYPHCTKLSIGHCAGCVALTQTANRFRWQKRDPEEVASEVAEEHCPPNFSPDLDSIINTNASLGMGQRRKENIIFESVEPDPKGHKLHGHY